VSIALAIKVHGLDPRNRMHVDLNVNGSGEIQIHTPTAAVHFNLDVEKLRDLLLMLDGMLEDYDRITLGEPDDTDIEDTMPL
jgi:hypothetical protein